MEKDLSNVIGKINTAKALAKKVKISVKSNRDNNDQLNRLPPGQKLLKNKKDFPILDLGIRPDFDSSTYRFEVTGLVNNPVSFSIEEILKLPKTSLTADFHCVTKWTQYNIEWTGVRFADLEKIVKPSKNAKFIIQYGLDNYTTNVSIDDLRRQNVILAYELRGKSIPKEHGWPVRLIIPHLYAWKGAKYLYRLDFRENDKPGFWEIRGYNNHGDPWKEERYSDT